jgi:murein DD-endopeptidase MepM/ murein hydrolase activator NlpD
MSNNKYYYYDHEEGIFMEADLPQNNHKRNLLLSVAGTLILACAAFWIGSSIWGSQQKDILSAENKLLRQSLSNTESRVDNLFSRLEELYNKDNKLYRVMLQAEPISEDVREVGIGGSKAAEDFSQYSPDTQRILGSTTAILDKLERQINLQTVSYQELLRKAERQSNQLRHKPAIMPIETGEITSGFGMRRHPVLGIMKQHSGIDMVLPIGTPVYATADGVVDAAEVKGGYGRTITLKHPESGYQTIYAHLSAFEVRAGQKVKRGDLIGKSGNSGMSTGPHLHYEVTSLDGTEKYDPMLFIISSLSPQKYRAALEATEKNKGSLD